MDGQRPHPPPHDSDAERAILGAMLLDSEVVPDVIKTVVPADFYHTAHQAIYTAMLELVTAGKPVEPTLLIDQLKKNGRLEEAGGFLGIAGLEQFVLATGGTAHLAALVAQKAQGRWLVSLSERVRDEVMMEKDPAAVLAFLGEEIRQHGAMTDAVLDAAWAPVDIFAPVEPLDWIFDGFLPSSSVVLLYGVPGCLKTWVATYLLACLAGRRNWKDGRPTRGPAVPVVLIENDSGKRVMQERIQAVMNALEVRDRTLEQFPFNLICPGDVPFNLTNPKHVSYWVEYVQRIGARVLVLDCLQNAAGDLEENSQEMAGAIRPARQIAEATGCAVILIHHAQKSGENYRGSSAILDLVDMSFQAQRDPIDGPEVVLMPRKQRLAQVAPIPLVFDFEHHADGRTLKSASFRLAETGSEVALPLLLDCLGVIIEEGETTQKAIFEDSRVLASRDSKRGAISHLAKRGLIRQTAGNRNSKNLSVTSRGTSFYESNRPNGGKNRQTADEAETAQNAKIPFLKNGLPRLPQPTGTTRTTSKEKAPMTDRFKDPQEIYRESVLGVQQDYLSVLAEGETPGELVAIPPQDIAHSVGVLAVVVCPSAWCGKQPGVCITFPPRKPEGPGRCVVIVNPWNPGNGWNRALLKWLADVRKGPLGKRVPADEWFLNSIQEQMADEARSFTAPLADLLCSTKGDMDPCPKTQA